MKSYLKKQKKNRIKISISIIMVILALAIFVETLNIQHDGIYLYKIEQDFKYRVYINSNEFISQDFIEGNSVYISDMVKYINLNFEYNYNASDLADLDSRYDIIANLYIDYANTNQNLLIKKYDILTNKSSILQDKNKINISENINIDYNMFNQEVLKFKEQYNLPIKAYLKVDFIINTGINLQNRIEKQSAIEATIDLNQPIFEVAEKLYGNESGEVSNLGEEIQKINKVLISISILLFVFGICYFIILMRFRIFSKENIYNKHLKNILKKYSDIIVELKEGINFNNFNIFEVIDLYDLIDVEEEIRQPILFFMDEKYKAVFFIIDNKIIYRYIFEL